MGSNFATDDLDAFAAAIKRAQRTLVEATAASGVFAAAGGVMAGAKFTNQYREWIAVIGTIAGVAGMLSVYLGKSHF